MLDETTEDYWAGSGSGPEDDDSLHNETREALTHEASDHDAVSTQHPNIKSCDEQLETARNFLSVRCEFNVRYEKKSS